MRKIHKLVVKAYISPFIVTFAIALFVLLLQFVWKYVDDFIGKGLPFSLILELLTYTSASLVPMALPLAILLSSLMTFGNMGEHFELVAMKSSGISLVRIMFPLIIVSILISVSALMFSNYVLPAANLKMGSLLWDIRHKRPSVSIKEGVFYGGIDGYNIRVNRKDSETDRLYDIMIYDHTEFQGNKRVITAKEGFMQMSTDEMYLILELENGYIYEEFGNKKNDPKLKRPHQKIQFGKLTKQFDISEFQLKRTDEQLFKENYQMLNIDQLVQGRDSMKIVITKKSKDLQNTLHNNYYFKKRNSLFKVLSGTNDSFGVDTLSEKARDSLINKVLHERVYEKALVNANNCKKHIETSVMTNKSLKRLYVRYKVEWHKKFTLSFACFILFFIGAPLGAIIRKGGLGLPVVVSAVFFIFFHILNMAGEKSAKEMALTAFQGLWLASAVLLPIGIFLTYKATTDSTLLDTEAYHRIVAPVIKLFKQKKKSEDEGASTL